MPLVYCGGVDPNGVDALNPDQLVETSCASGALLIISVFLCFDGFCLSSRFHYHPIILRGSDRSVTMRASCDRRRTHTGGGADTSHRAVTTKFPMSVVSPAQWWARTLLPPISRVLIMLLAHSDYWASVSVRSMISAWRSRILESGSRSSRSQPAWNPVSLSWPTTFATCSDATSPREKATPQLTSLRDASVEEMVGTIVHMLRHEIVIDELLRQTPGDPYRGHENPADGRACLGGPRPPGRAGPCRVRGCPRALGADLLACREQRLPGGVAGADGVAQARAESGHQRDLATVFGTVTVTRIAYRAPGAVNLYQADVA
jgi:hypothetical protein